MVQPYRDSTPIFAKAGIESQLDRMLQPQVTLKSGGYIIINQTEALVAVDVNSGRSTREHSIEDTALQTNLEASEEVARQLRLRDLAGLIVIDFIDMEENRNNRAVEKRLKDCLKNDRARIQVGRISHFGLMEMSRQRIRTSVLESTTQVCPQCGGVGHVRSPSSISLHIIRSIEEYLLRESGFDIVVRTPTGSALYVLNHKRETLSDLENRFGVNISIEADESVGALHLAIDKGAVSTRVPMAPKPSALPDFDENDPDVPMEDEEIDDVIDENDDDEKGGSEEAITGEPRDADGKRSKRRRRRRGRGRDGESDAQRPANGEISADGDVVASDADGEEEPNGTSAEPSDKGDGDRKKRRRGRRGGRRTRNEDGSENTVETVDSVQDEAGDTVASAEAVETVAGEVAPVEPAAEEVVKPKRSRAKKPKAEAVEAITAEAAPATEVEVAEVKPEKKTRARRSSVAVDDKSDLAVSSSEPVVSETAPETADAEAKPRKGGWWQRKGFF